jgi:hypothetical protein
VYLVPHDAPSRFKPVAARIQADAFGASALLERLYRRAIRFDMGTSCGPRYLDISEFRLSATRAELARAAQSNDPDAVFNLVRSQMRQAGFLLFDSYNPNGPWEIQSVNYVAWLDGPGPSASCGQATSLLDTRRVPWNRNNTGGKLALIYRRGRGFCGSQTVRHEIGHNLGALQPDAPHTRDGAHCTDALEDTMCEGGAPAVAPGAARGARNAVYFDYGNDDYWDPPDGRPLKWWTLNLSWFLCENPRCNR